MSAKADTVRMVAFLRGLNVGKNHRVKNPELEAILGSLDLENATGFLASGNVVFDVDAARASKVRDLATTVATKLESELGYAVPTMLRSSEEVRAIAEAEPFANIEQTDFAGKMQVLLIDETPTTATARALCDLATDDDLVCVDGATLYWLPRGSILDSAVKPTDMDKIAGPATMRTANTMQRIAKKFLSEQS